MVVSGAEPERGTRLFHVDLASGERTALSPEGMDPLEIHVMPGGDGVIGHSSERGYQRYPIPPGEPQPVPWLESQDRIVKLGSDGRTGFVWRHSEIPARAYRVDLETRERSLWRELTPPDPTGIYRIARLQLSSDGTAFAYTYYMHLMDMHVVEGLR